MRDLDYRDHGGAMLFCVKVNNPREYLGLMDYLHKEGFMWKYEELINNEGPTVHFRRDIYVVFEPDTSLIFAVDAVLDPHNAVSVKEFFREYASDPFDKLFSVLDKLEKNHEKN